MTEEIVRRAIQVWIDTPSGEKVWPALLRLIRDKAMAVELYEFVPLAFGRYFLSGLGVTLDPEYIRVDRRGRERHRGPIGDVAAFQLATALAPEYAERARKTQDGSFMAVAATSGEVKAVSELIANGSKAVDIVCVPPVMDWRGTSEKPSWRFW
ncbi:MAG: hypothetical protein ACRC8S_04845 [Fimbriiglobus sp.]